ncbi:hypothetical protein M0P65_07225 [Candidatus Gracilibacteria bacterium]|nr:hypothetical protein [Candidatus Gracilibacteria bacterium]
MSSNIYAFIGDRFLCKREVENTISSLQIKDNWEVKYIEEYLSFNDLYWNINSKDIFGPKNKIYVLDGFIPEPSEDFVGFLENLSKNKCIIFIFDEKQTPDKRTVFGKFIAGFTHEYPSMFTDKGFLDQRVISKAKNLIREISGWNGSDECLDFIMEKSDYEYGSILSEIEKIDTFLGEHPNKIEEIKSIVCQNDLIRMEDIFDKIQSRDIVGSLESIMELIDNNLFKEYYMMFFLGLLDKFTFMMYFSMAKEMGNKDIESMCSFVSDNYQKNKKQIPIQLVRGRFFFIKDYLPKWNTSDIQLVIKAIEESINACLLNKRSDRFIVENFLAQTM